MKDVINNLGQWTEKILKKYSFGVALIFFGITFLICTGIAVYLIILNSESFNQLKDVSKTGPLGDTFNGLLGPFIAFLIAILTFLAFYIQYQANQIQIDALKDQETSSRLTQFESTFFNLLKVQQDLRNNSEYKDFFDKELNRPASRSVQSFNKIYSELWEKFRSVKETIEVNLNKDLEDRLKILNINDDIQPAKITDLKQINKEIKIARIAYYIIFSENSSWLSHYFRNLYHILKFVREKESQEINVSQKESDQDFIKKTHEKYKRYADLVQAQMSPSELSLLFYNAICFPKMKILIHVYDFLENISKDDLIYENHTEFYKNYSYDDVDYDDVIFKDKQDILELNNDD